MVPRLAILAGTGALPQALMRADPDALMVTFDGIDVKVPPASRHLQASFERLGALFDGLHKHAVNQVVFAGAMTRPQLDPANFDAKTRAVMPAIITAMAGGDDGLLRQIIRLFEAEGFGVRAAHEVMPTLMLPPDTVRGRPAGAGELADAQRALDILAALSPEDVAQACVVEGGLCLGIETIQGTDAMLGFVAQTPAHLRRGRGVFVKAAKTGQDLRADVPTIGPDTVRGVAAAGLCGLIIAAGGVMVLEQEEVFRLLGKHDLFLIAH